MSLSPCLGVHQFGHSGALEVSERHNIIIILCKFAFVFFDLHLDSSCLSFLTGRVVNFMFFKRTLHGNNYKPLFEDSISLQFLIEIYLLRS